MSTVYPLSAIRALALHATGLDIPNGQEPPATLENIFQVVDRLGAVQIDTLQMVARAQYLTIWSRLGSYDPALFDRMANDQDSRLLFEGWFHAASFIPIHEFRYQIPRQKNLQENGHYWYNDWIRQPGNLELMNAMLERVRVQGELRATDLEGEKKKFATWWDWRPEKLALEHLWSFGDLMISRRHNFQRYYDLTERVLPAWVDQSEPEAEESDLYLLERGAKALGIGLPRNPADYTLMRGNARSKIAGLVKSSRLIEVQGETLNGVKTLILHPDNLENLEKAAAGEIQPRRTTFLNPFDNFWYGRERDEAFWGFRQRLEAYSPAHKRIYGYYCLPILHKDRLVGRFDPKLERKTGLLRVKALYLEPGVEPDEELLSAIASTMRDFMLFHRASDLLIEKSDPDFFAGKLLSQMVVTDL